MKKYLFHVGVDISKLTLDVAVFNINSPMSVQHLVVANSEKGVKEIIKYLEKQQCDLLKVLFCCENTGVYTYPLTTYLSENGYDHLVVPAIEIKRAKGISRGKSDKTDAKDIALYSLRNIDKLSLSTIAVKEIQKLKLLYTERQKIMKALLIFKSTPENKGFINKEVYTEVEALNSRIIKDLELALKKAELKIRDIINTHSELKQQLELIKSVPGVGPQTAIYLIIATKGFTAFNSWRKFACYSGIAPFEYSSGSSIRARTKVNHIADKKMKSLLQMCAMSAVRHDAQIREYYQKKKAEGKHSMLVMNNVRNKIISRIFAIINRQSPFVNTYGFSI